jgi:hypothetical protein
VAAQVTAALERQMAPHGRAPNLRLVDNYVAAFHVKDSELLHWAMTHPEYTRPQVSSHPPCRRVNQPDAGCGSETDRNGGTRVASASGEGRATGDSGGESRPLNLEPVSRAMPLHETMFPLPFSSTGSGIASRGLPVDLSR